MKIKALINNQTYYFNTAMNVWQDARGVIVGKYCVGVWK
jgi:hypothetical protein